MDYGAILLSLPQKVRESIILLDSEGQIDYVDGTPHIVDVRKDQSTYTIKFKRNGQDAFIIQNTRKKMPPIESWNRDDGYIAKERRMPDEQPSETNEERPLKHKLNESLYHQIVSSIMSGK